MTQVCILGRGKLGRALFHALTAGGKAHALRAQLVRGHPLPRALPPSFVFVLAVPDAQIAPTARALAPRLAPGSVLLHCAGARTQEELQAARAHGLYVGAMHPLVSFASPRSTPTLRGATFVVQGDKKAQAAAHKLARAMGARCVPRAVLGPAYHAAAALTANGTVGLAFVSAQILTELGMSKREAERGLAHMLHTVADNLERVGLPRALTGPVVRGDAATVERHLSALRALDPELADAYARVQPLVLTCARAAGLSPASARALERAWADSSPRKSAPRTANRKARR